MILYRVGYCLEMCEAPSQVSSQNIFVLPPPSLKKPLAMISSLTSIKTFLNEESVGFAWTCVREIYLRDVYFIYIYFDLFFLHPLSSTYPTPWLKLLTEYGYYLNWNAQSHTPDSLDLTQVEFIIKVVWRTNVFPFPIFLILRRNT